MAGGRPRAHRGEHASGRGGDRRGRDDGASEGAPRPAARARAAAPGAIVRREGASAVACRLFVSVGLRSEPVPSGDPGVTLGGHHGRELDLSSTVCRRGLRRRHPGAGRAAQPLEPASLGAAIGRRGSHLDTVPSRPRRRSSGPGAAASSRDAGSRARLDAVRGFRESRRPVRRASRGRARGAGASLRRIAGRLGRSDARRRGEGPRYPSRS